MSLQNLLAVNAGALILDIVCIALLVVWGVRGAKKGFVSCIIHIVSTALALILAFALAKVMANALESMFHMRSSMSAKFVKSFAKIKGFSTDISGEGLAEAALKKVSLPSFIADAVKKEMSKINSYPEGTTLATVTGPVVANFLCTLIGGAVVFALAKLVLFVIGKLLTGIVEKIPLVGTINAVLGFVFGVFQMALVVSAVLAFFSLFAKSGMTDFFNNATVLKWLYNKNLFNTVIGWIITK